MTNLRSLFLSALVLATAACGKGAPAMSDKPRDMVAERAKITEFKDKACACKDAACADKVGKELEAWMMTDRGVAPQQSEAEAKIDLDLFTQFITCTDAARGVKN